MPIYRISIQNFKSIRELNNFRIQPINVLIGSNGAGKSNFIEFFKLLNAIVESRLPSYVAERGYAEKLLYLGSKQSSQLAGEIIFQQSRGSNTNNSYDFILKPDQDSGLFFEKERGGFNWYHARYGENWDYYILESEGTKNTKIHDHGASRFDFIVNYFYQFKVFHFHDTSKNAPLKKPASVRDNESLREDGSNLSAFLYLIQEKHPANFKVIEHTIRSIAPFFEKFTLSPDRLNPDFIQLTWKEKGSDTFFTANDLSDGSIRFIALATLLLQPFPPATIIIDEPELGLHPMAIAKLGSLIKVASGKSQIILSTQSVPLLNQFTPEDVIVVERDNGQSVFRRLNSDDLKAWVGDFSIGEMWERNILGGSPS